MTKYSFSTASRSLTLFAFAGFLLVGAFLTVAAFTRSDGPPILFTIAWLVILGWNGYWWLWRFSYRVEVDGDRLTWMTPLRRGDARLADIEGVHFGWLGQITVIMLRDQNDVKILTRKGIEEFVEALTGDRLKVPFFQRAGELGRSGFRREG